MTAEKKRELNVMAFLYNGCHKMLDEAQRRLMLGHMAIKVGCFGSIAMLSRLRTCAKTAFNNKFNYKAILKVPL